MSINIMNIVLPIQSIGKHTYTLSWIYSIFCNIVHNIWAISNLWTTSKANNLCMWWAGPKLDSRRPPLWPPWPGSNRTQQRSHPTRRWLPQTRRCSEQTQTRGPAGTAQDSELARSLLKNKGLETQSWKCIKNACNIFGVYLYLY